ncbi:hypothetical protein C5167_006197 [Papaver somniferum]|uniref:Small ribosomal subunit protein uS17 N-terminal domain-containing protein n=1 Tax=Papaver somniferum TaxID=3469 RepID=A0A4Y7JEE5_PAPSO|nr:hypothetical protein C5167_006197 [Papaver somniferum]
MIESIWKGKRPGKGGNRNYQNVGLGFKSPREAIDRTRIDKKCPITDKVSIRGCFVAGAGHSAKMLLALLDDCLLALHVRTTGCQLLVAVLFDVGVCKWKRLNALLVASPVATHASVAGGGGNKSL